MKYPELRGLAEARCRSLIVYIDEQERKDLAIAQALLAALDRIESEELGFIQDVDGYRDAEKRLAALEKELRRDT